MTHTAALARLHFLLPELYAEAVRITCRRRRVPLGSVELCGLHGQTIFHEGAPIEFLGRRVASTFQIGDPAIFAERTGIRTISNFRERDIAAGGNGAPLVPFVDYLLYHHSRTGRVALNIGGIANITIVHPGADSKNVIAFDTGPGNMVMDALVNKLTDGKQTYDSDGRIARLGTVHTRLLDSMLSDPYFSLPPPKTAGREQFGQEFASGLIATGLPLADLVATATELTARSIAAAIGGFAQPGYEVIASGGGVHNRWLMRRLRELLPVSDLQTSAAFGIDPDAKEAIAFALLAYQFVMRRTGNLPSATGARRAVLLGRSTPA
jgi:anhydro-N-acetylmuramic acid kinase